MISLYLFQSSSGLSVDQNAVGTPLCRIARLNRTLLPGEITCKPVQTDAELSPKIITWDE